MTLAESSVASDSTCFSTGGEGPIVKELHSGMRCPPNAVVGVLEAGR